MDSLLDENSLNKLNEAAFDLEEDHFGRQEDPHRQEGQQMEMVDLEQQVKVLLFWKTKESSDRKMREKLKQRLEAETELFL